MHISSIASTIKLLKLKTIVTSQKSVKHATIGLGISCTLRSEPRRVRKFMFCRVRNGTRICFLTPLPLATGKSQNFLLTTVDNLCTYFWYFALYWCQNSTGISSWTQFTCVILGTKILIVKSPNEVRKSTPKYLQHRAYAFSRDWKKWPIGSILELV